MQSKPDFHEEGKSTWKRRNPDLVHPAWDKDIKEYSYPFSDGAEFVWRTHVQPLHEEVNFWKKAFEEEQRRGDELRMKLLTYGK